jgi:hypothetical protein
LPHQGSLLSLSNNIDIPTDPSILNHAPSRFRLTSSTELNETLNGIIHLTVLQGQARNILIWLQKQTGLPHSVAAQLFIIHPRDFDVDIDAVQQRTRNPPLIFGDQGMSAGAGLLGVPVEPTGAGVYTIEHIFRAQ